MKNIYRMVTFVVTFVAAFMCCSELYAASPDSIEMPAELTRAKYVQMVLIRNPTLRSAEMDYRIAKLQTLREEGYSQPYLEMSAESENNVRENTTEQQLTQLNRAFEEENVNYSAGITGDILGGATYRIGYSLADLSNNLFAPEQNSATDPFASEYVTFAGLNITQPLLKNRGSDVSVSDLRVAQMRERMARESVRRERMAAIARGGAAYLGAYMAQEAVGLRKRSLEIAESLLKDIRERKKKGKASELDVEEAEAGMKLRQIRLLEARRGKFESMQALLDMVQLPMGKKNCTLHVPELPPAPDVKKLRKKYGHSFDAHPDVAIRQQEVDLAKLRLDVSHNQRLPELNLLGSFGYNGLGESVSDSMDQLESGDYDSWSVGLILRVPLGKGKDELNQLRQAHLSYDKAEMVYRDTRTQIENALTTSLERVGVYHDYFSAQEEIVEITKTRLETQRKLADAGKISMAAVLEAEELVSDSEAQLLDVRMRYIRAHIQMELTSGVLLEAYDAELDE